MHQIIRVLYDINQPIYIVYYIIIWNWYWLCLHCYHRLKRASKRENERNRSLKWRKRGQGSQAHPMPSLAHPRARPGTTPCQSRPTPVLDPEKDKSTMSGRQGDHGPVPKLTRPRADRFYLYEPTKGDHGPVPLWAHPVPTRSACTNRQKVTTAPCLRTHEPCLTKNSAYK